MIPRQDSLKWPIRGNVGLRPQTGTFDRFSALPDPGRGGGGEDGLQRIFFGPLGLTLVYKKEGRGPAPPGLLFWIHHCSVILKCKDFIS